MLFNRERALSKMEEFKLDAIIASHPENVSYLSDFQNHASYVYRLLNRESYALLPMRGDIAPALIISTADASWAARFPTWVEEVYTFGNSFYLINPEGTLSEGEIAFRKILDDKGKNATTAGDAIVKALKQKGLDKGRIGLDEKNLYPRTREKIVSELPNASIIDAYELFRVIRMVKTPEELERLKTVGLLNERAANSVIECLAEGVTEDELTQQFLESIAKEGAIFEFWNTASGTQSSMFCMTNGHFHPPSGYRLKKVDIFRYDGGSIYNKYHADVGGCAVLGPPTQRQKFCYNGIKIGIERAIELLKPGAIPSKIYQEAVAATVKTGIKDFDKAAGHCGHGIGIEARDYPILTHPVKATSPFLPGSYDLPIEENMVICVELPYKELGLGGLQIEYTLLVEKDGCKKLYPHERDLYVR